ncbi:tether containing UBX domain for GLUT4 [Aricia agestis]|uniref:tether containing UBX domain for GLUT4 n=1 Tax=Aricia agestis TaxID=91739 RepID=UPI001C20BDB8|nr:tether containing UBX domain for GLUT4 [Aricia agestis]
MSRDLTVLAPNGRRTKVHCTPDTTFLKVLEDVCAKQGYEASDYDLKHHNHVLDLTTTVRFCNIPNRATLEMVEAEKKRVESNVTIGLTLEDGERRTGDFSPNTSLHDIVIALAPEVLNSLQNPMITYMRQEVIGLPAFKEKTLRQLGLLTGRAILRLLDKIHTEQANVSSVYRKVQEKIPETECNSKEINISLQNNMDEAGPSEIKKEIDNSNHFDPIKLLKKEAEIVKDTKNDIKQYEEKEELNPINKVEPVKEQIKIDENKCATACLPVMDQQILERRLCIEDEVSFVGPQKAIAFMQPDQNEDELADLPDDFYDLSIDEVKKIYHELQKNRIELENIPLLISSKRNEIQSQQVTKIANTYKNTVVRIQFPDRIILQGVFSPSNTIEDVFNFVKEHLHNPNQSFHIFSTPLKETLDPKMTLLEAKFVPCVLMHFKWADDTCNQQYLKEEIYSQKTSSDAACILASKYRAPSRRKLEHENPASGAGSSKSKESKVPKWFKK